MGVGWNRFYLQEFEHPASTVSGPEVGSLDKGQSFQAQGCLLNPGRGCYRGEYRPGQHW